MKIGLRAVKIGLRARKIGLRAVKIGLRASRIGLTAAKIGLRASRVGLTAATIGLRASRIGLTAVKIGLTAVKIGLRALVLGQRQQTSRLPRAKNGVHAPSTSIFRAIASPSGWSTGRGGPDYRGAAGRRGDVLVTSVSWR